MTPTLRSRLSPLVTPLVSLALLGLLTPACSGMQSPMSAPPAQHAPAAPPSPADVSAAAEMDASSSPPSLPSQPGAPASHKSFAAALPGGSGRQAKQSPSGDVASAGMQQKLIFTSRLDMLVDGGDVAATLDKVVDIAAELGGYIADQNDMSVTVRVPSGQFRDAMRDIEKQGEVVHRSVKAQDVTEEFHDIGVRLKSLLATRARLQKFLDRAKSINEVLRVEQELTRLNGQIDKLQGRLRFLEARAAFSTIVVALRQRPKAVPKIVKKKVVKEVAPPPPPTTTTLPIDWLSRVGVDNLLRMK